MAWITKTADVEVTQEMEYDDNRIMVTDAYEVEITDAYLQSSADENSKSVSIAIGIKNEKGETGKTFFTVLGRDGETFFLTKDGGKKQHFGLSIANTLFGIVLGKEIFDVEPETIEYETFDKDTKKMKKVTGDGFPGLIGKKVGVCYQMIREISGTDSKEFGEIRHFFDLDTGLFFGEEKSDNTKLDKWMRNPKAFIVKETAVQAKSSFGKKKEAPKDGEAPKNKWGRG